MVWVHRFMTPMQIRLCKQQAEFVLERFFRPLEAMRRLTDTERKVTDRLMSLVAAMKYQRKKPKEKKKPVERWWE